MCVTCGCGGKPASYEKIDKKVHKTTTKEIKETQEVHVHHKEKAKKKP